MMRASGILLPISSIPSNYGIGCFSKEAYTFVDQLAEAGVVGGEEGTKPRKILMSSEEFEQYLKESKQEENKRL